MKRILFLILVLFAAGACLDDKTNTDYRDINNFDGNSWKITGIESRYSLFPGESVTITPEVRLSIDTLNPDVECRWMLGDTEVATGPSYTFEAKEYGEYTLTFLATDKKTGVSFPAETDLLVAPQYKLGWLFLSRTASGNSRLSLLAGKRIYVPYMDGNYQRQRDSLVYVGFYTNLGESLGSGPIKLIEEFTYQENYNVPLTSEIMVLQESGPIELGGYELDFTGNPLDEFSGVAPRQKIKDAALSWSCKWLQTEDNLLYYSVARVTSDLHSGRYSDDPAFNGAKYKTLVEVMKSGGYYAPKFFLAIDETNTMWALIDNGSEKYNSGGLVDPLNSIGSRARLINNSSGNFDMSLFNNFTGRYIKHVLVNTDEYFLSLIERNGKYLWHKYALDFPYRYTTGDDVKVESSETGELTAEMFTNFKDAAFVYGYYGDWEWLFVASGNKLYGTVMDWNEPLQDSREIFTASADIVSVKVRYFGNSMSNEENIMYCHLGVLLKDGTFLVLEINYESDAFTVKKIYEENLKELDTEIVDVVDMIHKYGSGGNFDGYLN
ncbi:MULTISPECIES: PKD-like family lipoprotein [Butyricimonas]|uniref:PKD-like family lipoprotein n=1 Tax=Butyricimonas TaxID=574697 RepID=UPI001D080F2B|nr:MULTISPECIES: PKD-like family lipoprotein [Butyricimonas]MCB6974521.1 hypothetical protein [Butyricimonas synergistica]MCG4521274.1 PKD-like family lipoprotein [Butyricimonas sp. DFI.6.44]